MSERSLRRGVMMTTDSFYELEQAVFKLFHSLIQLQLALLQSNERQEQMSETEKKLWLRHIHTLLKTLDSMQSTLICRYEIVHEWETGKAETVHDERGTNASDVMRMFHSFADSHPREWMKIRLLLHNILSYPQRKKKFHYSHAYCQTQPWLSPLLEKPRS